MLLSNSRKFRGGVGFQGSDPRPTLLVFGNSLAGQANIVLAANTTTTTANALAGSTSLTVVSSAAFTAGDKVAIQLYTGEIFKTTIASVPDGTHLTLTDKLPNYVRGDVGQSVQRYTTDKPSGIRRQGGTIAAAMSLLGNPVNIVQGYGYGGGLGKDMPADLALCLRRVRPQYVYLQLFENDIGAGAPLADMQALARAAVDMCVKSGARPMVATPFPSTSYNSDPKVAVYDALKTYILTSLLALYPTMIPINCSEAWVDPAAPTRRNPLTAVSADGIHPKQAKWPYVGSVIAPQIAPALQADGVLMIDPSKWSDMALTLNALMTGTGGTKAGAGAPTGNAPDGWTFTAEAGVTLALSKTGEGYQRMDYSVAGASNISSTRALFSQSKTLAINMSGGQMVKGFVLARLNSLANISMFYPAITFSGGEVYSGHQDADDMTDTVLPGNVIMRETAPLEVPLGTTTAFFEVALRPLTLGSPSGVSASIDIIAAGIIPAEQPVRGGIVLP